MRIVVRFLVVLAALFFSGPEAARAQGPGSVRGAVVAAATGQPLAGAAVRVRAAADSATAGSAVADSAGRFRVAGLTAGRYLVIATMPGYAPLSRAVTLSADTPDADLGALELAGSVLALEGITVEAERSAVAIAPDRTAYTTRDMPVASGGVATDVLRSVPELEVDVEGAVSLRGTAARIYLNGRPAPMEGEALQQFLEQFPADRIDRVEVIANPSARFQAEGAGGIVNIVLKENADLGLSGSVFTNAGTRGDLGGGGRLAYQRGRLTLFGGSFLRLSRRDQTSYDLRSNLLADPVTRLEQDARTERDGLSGNLDLTAEWKLTPRSTVWSEVGVYRNGWESESLTEYTLTDLASGPLERYDRFVDGDTERFSTDLSAGFRHVLEPGRHELATEVRWENGTDDESSLVRELPLLVAGGDDLAEESFLDASGEDERELSVELDYVRPWGERGQVEAGYRGERETEENRRSIRPLAGAAEAGRTAYAHRETFHSVYLIATRPFGALGVQLGTRAELARSRFELPLTGERFDRDHSSLFPSANLTYDFGEGRQARLSYTRRIRRPNARVLNPLDRSSDPLNRYVGNPDIDPQYTHSLSLETSWVGQAGSLRFSPYYRRTEGDWTEIKRVDEAGVSTVTWENLASVESYGTSLTASLRPAGGVSGFASISGSREVRDASNLSLDYSGASFRWSARGNVSARLGRSTSLQGMVFYMPARDVPQGRISSRLMTHFGLRQQLMGDRASVSLMVTDPFDLSRTSFRTSDPTHVQTGRSSWRARSATLSFSYSFGRPPRDARDRDAPEEEQEDEARIR
jgi:hypothetical protein